MRHTRYEARQRKDKLKQEILKLILVARLNTYEIQTKLHLAHSTAWDLIDNLESEGKVKVVKASKFRTGLKVKLYQTTREGFFEALEKEELGINELARVIRLRPDFWPFMNPESDALMKAGEELWEVVFRIGCLDKGESTQTRGDLAFLFSMALNPDAERTLFWHGGIGGAGEEVVERLKRPELERLRPQVVAYLHSRTNETRRFRDTLAKQKRLFRAYLKDIETVESRVASLSLF